MNKFIRNKLFWKSLFTVWTLLFVCVSAGYAADFDLVLQWDENTEPDLAFGDNPRYKIYYKTGSSGAGVKSNYIGLPSSEPGVADEGASPVAVTVASDENPDPAIVQFTLHNLEDTQDYFIAVTALDNYGNESDLSNEISYDGSVAPPPPVNSIPILSTLRVNGAVNSTAVYTNNSNGDVSVQIVASDSDGTVNQYLILDNNNNPSNGTFINIPSGANASQNFTVTFRLSGDGTHTLYAWVKDDNGDISAITSKSNIYLDRIPPAAPTVIDLSSGDDTGVSTTDNITNRTSALTISGSGEEGAVVQLYDGTTVIGSPVTVSGGTFTIDISLSSGTHALVARQTDRTGNISSNSAALAITVDTAAPTGVISYNTTQTSHVDVGSLVITATFTENLSQAPQIAISGGGVLDITSPVNMSGSGKVWTRSLTVPWNDNKAYGITISRITDVAGNAASALVGNFVTDTTDTDGDGVRDYVDTDDDNDGMPDTWETQFGLNPKVNDAASDSDGDGVSNLDEFMLQTNPSVPDGNLAPNYPELIAPETDAVVSVTPELTIGEFSDPNAGDTHDETEWQICLEVEGTGDSVYELKSNSAIKSLQVPPVVLNSKTNYAWRARVYDNHGAPSEWSDYGYFTTGENPADTNNDGIIDTQVPDPSTDLDQDGTLDTEQIDIKSIKVRGKATLIGMGTGGSPKVVKIISLQSSDPTDTSQYPEMAPPPGEMPYGLIDFKIKVSKPGEAVQMTIFFSAPISSNSIWYKYDSILNVWYDFSQYATVNSNLRSMTLYLEDGGPGDSDGLANGMIIDPSGLVEVTGESDPEPPQDQDGDNASAAGAAAAEGGCFIDAINVNDGTVLDKFFFWSFIGLFMLFLYINKDLKKN